MFACSRARSLWCSPTMMLAHSGARLLWYSPDLVLACSGARPLRCSPTLMLARSDARPRWCSADPTFGCIGPSQLSRSMPARPPRVIGALGWSPRIRRSVDICCFFLFFLFFFLFFALRYSVALVLANPWLSIALGAVAPAPGTLALSVRSVGSGVRPAPQSAVVVLRPWAAPVLSRFVAWHFGHSVIPSRFSSLGWSPRTRQSVAI